VDAGIRASGALGEGLFTCEVFDSGHQRTLHRCKPRLNLPSGEVMAVVGECELEISLHLRCVTLFNVRERD
jgi:hypothetical protein